MKWKLWIGFLCCIWMTQLPAVELARYSIAVSPDASPAENNAAGELRKHLVAGTGVNPGSGATEYTIWVGQGARVRELCPDIDFAALEPDEIIVRSIGNELVLTGGRPRGTLYAVYEFLESLGFRWWTATEGKVPDLRGTAMPEFNLRYAPPIRVRDVAFYEAINFMRFAVRLRLNGANTIVGPEWGGRNFPLGFVHTMDMLIPASEYMKTHPEYFALRNGQRVGGQLCLSNPEVRKLLLAKALLWLRAEDAPTMISISQNDNLDFCQCPDCAAFDKRTGSPSGILIDAVNEVAAGIAAEFPAVMVETLAYTYSRKAPTQVVPRQNVLVRLCSFECRFDQPLDHPVNADFFTDLEAWSRIAPQLAVWNYTADCANYLILFPNIGTMAANYRLLRRHRVINIFEEGAFNSGFVADMPELKTWMMAKLLWNPDLDATALRNEFLNGYYGPAGTYIGEVIDLTEAALLKSGIPLTLWRQNPDYLTPEVIVKCIALFDAAEAAAAHDTRLAARVRMARFSLDFSTLMLYPRALRNGEPYPAVTRDYARKLLEEAAARGCVFKGSETPLRHDNSYRALLNLGAQGTLPKRFAALKSDEVFEFQDCALIPLRGEIANDAAASDGTAVRIPGNSAGPAVQTYFSWALDVVPAGQWRVFAAVRNEGEGSAQLTLRTRNSLSGKEAVGNADTTEIGTREYGLVDLGVHELDPNCNIILEAALADKPAALCLDRLILVREK